MHPLKPLLRLLLLLALFVAAVLVALRPALAAADPPLLAVHFLDVGQGDAIWVQTPNGEDMLIDGGPEEAGPGVVAYLQSHGCADVEYMVLTHAHDDHVGGLITVLESMPVVELWYSGEVCSTTVCSTFQGLATDKCLPRFEPLVGPQYSVGGLGLAVLNPTTLGSNSNDNSLVFRLSMVEVDVLLTGDIKAAAEGAILAGGQRLDAEVLKVAHHGSETSSSQEFLRAVSPEVAVISVGEENTYGHPSGVVIDRLAALPARVYRTDRQGTVVLLTDGTTYSILTPDLHLVFLPLAIR